MAEYTKSLPVAENPLISEPFWQATKRHELIIPRCRKCNKLFFYPREACPFCLQADWEWETVSGRARLYSYTTVHQAQNPAFQDDAPYVFALVQLEEGPKMISNVVEYQSLGDVRVDMPLVAQFDDVTPDWTLVKFRPA